MAEFVGLSSPVSIRIQTNRKEWIKLARAVGRVLTDNSLNHELAYTMTARIRRLTKEQFKNEGRKSLRGQYKPLSEPYGSWKAKHFPGKTILRRTDRLYRKATTRNATIRNISVGKNISYEIDDKIGAGHQLGHGRLPVRRLFDPSRKQQLGMTASIGRTIVDGIFSREFFDNRKGRPIVFKNTGFDKVSVSDTVPVGLTGFLD